MFNWNYINFWFVFIRIFKKKKLHFFHVGAQHLTEMFVFPFFQFNKQNK